MQTEVTTDNSGKAAGLGAMAASSAAVIACGACCILPLALPAIALASLGGTLAWLAGAHPWLTGLSVLIVIAAWAWIIWQGRRTGKRQARSTLVLMSISTAFTLLALAWPWIEPSIMAALR